MTTKKVDFAALEKIDVTKHVEKKGRFSYLSWPYAVSAFRKACPGGFWRIAGVDRAQPYICDKTGAYVVVTVHTDADCPGFMQVHPVLNHQNKPITTPTAFDINTSIQRCLVKAIALATGIGLHIYAGEDLPPDSEAAPVPPPLTPTQIADTLMLALTGSVDLPTLGLVWNDKQFQAELKTLPPELIATVEACKDNRKKQLEEVAV